MSSVCGTGVTNYRCTKTARLYYVMFIFSTSVYLAQLLGVLDDVMSIFSRADWGIVGPFFLCGVRL